MIVGHLGATAGLAHVWPRASIWWLAGACIAPDLLDIGYALAGVCNPDGLYSHTLPAAMLLGAGVAGAAVLAGRRATAPVAVLAVLLHLPLDWVTGRKLFWPTGGLHGLGLYENRPADFILESVLLAAGWSLLRRQRVGALPAWTRTAWALALAIAVQGGALAFTTGKPTACVLGPAARTSP